jgi:hypothetical protein
VYLLNLLYWMYAKVSSVLYVKTYSLMMKSLE